MVLTEKDDLYPVCLGCWENSLSIPAREAYQREWYNLNERYLDDSEVDEKLYRLRYEKL